MASSIVVFYKIATTCLLILVGFLARRMKILPENSIAFVSKYIVNVSLPAYMIYYMPASVSPDTLAAYWHYPLLGAFLVALLDLFGHAVARLRARPGEYATFRLLVAFPNWIFMALAVCEPLFGAEGIRMVLLYNIGLMFYLWTFGMTGFRPSAGLGETARKLLLNTQTAAMLLGLAVALLLPSVNGLERLGMEELAALPPHLGLLSPVWETIYLVSSTTMPLAILQIGMLLGARGPEKAEGRGEGRSVALASACRLIAAPILVVGVQAALFPLGLLELRGEFVSSVIIMGMPVATLSFTVAEVHGGAVRLAARTILWSTVASLATAPFVTWIAETAFRSLG